LGPRRTSVVACLLFLSGACALAYQTVWLRQLRLIFGASTDATAAVLAVFMGGLGLGSAVLGGRSDRKPRPLRFYGALELGIAVAAALSPLLLWSASAVYVGLGGSRTLGPIGATLARLFLAAIVLGVPACLMGGTLPAAARAVETPDDRRRRSLAVLYAANAVGALAGTLLATFYALESLGHRRTLLWAAALNLAVGTAAWRLGGEPRAAAAPKRGMKRAAVAASPVPVFLAAAIVGFAFLLMELVWYRMLAPLLGGTTYTFGMILAAALLGIGLGAAACSLTRAAVVATPGVFALTCALEALAIIAPYAAGDRLAELANVLRALGRLGFAGDLAGWSAVIGIVVLPAAVIAGFQFPLLLSLLGSGDDAVGRHVGLAYAWNTAGAIAGALAGGFGLMPALTAPGCWRAAAALLALTALGGAGWAWRAGQGRWAVAAAAVAAAALVGTSATGPTAVWRHSGIGAGRAAQPDAGNDLRAWENTLRRTLQWDADGRESSIALVNDDDLAFLVNGKSDGSTRGDAATQVMGGLVGAILHPEPQRALVIGLGTGSTAGWLSAVPTIRRVDTVEIEPVVLRVAQACAAVNRDVLRRPSVVVTVADGREFLLTSTDRYDIIFSEPSNPYRAGVASLFTTEFYAAAAARLHRGGIFLQWVQAYDVDVEAIRTIYATIRAVFPEVATWRTGPGDLLLSASAEPIVYDGDVLRRRLAQDPYRSAMHVAWRVEDAEGFLSHYIASPALATAIAEQAAAQNTDDRTLIEFRLGRALGRRGGFRLDALMELAERRQAARPDVRGPIDWTRVAHHRASDPTIGTVAAGEAARHRQFAVDHRNGDLVAALATWRTAPWAPLNTLEQAELAEVWAEAGRDEAVPLAERLRPWQPVEADAILARLRLVQRRYGEAADLLTRALVRYREDPWPSGYVMERALESAVAIARADPSLAAQMAAALGEPFAAGQWNDRRRLYAAVVTAGYRGCGAETIRVLQAIEPDVPWRRDFLELRRDCYARAGLDALATRAARELAEFDRAAAPLVR
jgi:spermidine synthase